MGIENLNEQNKMHLYIYNIETVKACQEFFGFQLPSVQLSRRTKKFEIQFHEISRPAKS